jgi:predicted nucleic acid-binding protein
VSPNRVAFDTNVVVSALLNSIGASGRVLELMLAGELTVAHDDRLPAEWRQVGEHRRHATRAEYEASGSGAAVQEMIQ